MACKVLILVNNYSLNSTQFPYLNPALVLLILFECRPSGLAVRRLRLPDGRRFAATASRLRGRRRCRVPLALQELQVAGHEALVHVGRDLELFLGAARRRGDGRLRAAGGAWGAGGFCKVFV